METKQPKNTKIKKWLCLLLVVCAAAALLLYSQNSNKKTDDQSSDAYVYNQEMGEEGSSALYIYMCGSNLETNHGSATKNIKELLEADLDENTTVIIETGGSAKWRKYDIDSDAISRYTIQNNELVLLEKSSNANMGESQTFEDFLNYCIKNYPAQKMGVVMWNHGSGALAGACFDENYGMDGLSLTEMDEALSNVRKNMTDQFDFIGFDACLMADYETSLMLSEYADYLVASQELEPSGGWNYASFASLGKDDFYTTLLEDYAQKCELNDKNTYTLSCIDLRNFDEVEKAFEELSQNLASVAQDGLQPIVNVASESTKFGSNTSVEGFSNLIDLIDFASQMEDTKLVSLLQERIQNINGSEKSSANGMSFYYPLASIDDVDEYLQISKSEEYRNFLQTNYVQADTQAELIEITGMSATDDGELEIELSSDSLKYISKIKYLIYETKATTDDDHGQSFDISLGRDDALSHETDTTYKTTFEGIWFVWENEAIQVEDVERSGSLVVYSTPVKVDGKEANVRFVYNEEDESIKIQGVLYTSDSQETSRLEELEEGAQITIMHHMFDENFESSWYEGQTFSYDPATQNNLCLDYLTDGIFQMYIVVSDIYGKEYFSDVANLERENNENKVQFISEGTNALIEIIHEHI